ncbi:MAG: hypothetical protein K0U61_13060 [Alphaproteobacteria bacterium]|nr:hypothetical protein [Alphaproteobacteria bacterium]
MAEAHLLEGNPTQAERAAAAALPHLASDKSYRDGWYYMVVAMRARALISLGQNAEAQLVLAEASNGIASGDASGTYSDCILGFAGMALQPRSTDGLQAQQRHVGLLQSCRDANPDRQDIPPPVQVHADAAFALIAN